MDLVREDELLEFDVALAKFFDEPRGLRAAFRRSRENTSCGPAFLP